MLTERSHYPELTYDTVARDLHDFYVLAGTGAAALVGLLFVGLSVHLRVVVATSEVRSLARITLANFGLVLIVSMFMVLSEGQSTAAWQLIGSGVATSIFVAPSLVAVVRIRELAGMSRGRFIMRFGLSALGYIAIIAAGLLLLVSQITAFSVVVEISIVVLMVVALRNAWDLMVTVGEITLENGNTRQ